MSCIIDTLSIDKKNLEVNIESIRITDPTMYTLLASMDTEEERKNFIEKTLSIGFDVVQIMDQTNRVDYVKSEFERMKTVFDQSFQEVFNDKGKLNLLLDDYFGSKGEVTDLLAKHFGDEGSVLSNLLNHSDDQTPLGKFRKDLEKILDINDENTAFYKLRQCIEEGLVDVKNQIEIRDATDTATAEERLKGTAKGRDFQEFLTEITDQIAGPLEDTVSFVGDDTGLVNKVGDVLIQINPAYTKGAEKSIIIEAKNSKINLTGKRSFLKELDEAMENRGSEYAIGAVHENSKHDSVGEFRRFQGNKIIVNIPEESMPLALEVAYKVARAEIIARVLSGEKGVDTEMVITKVEEIKSKLEVMRATKRSLTTAKDNIDTAYDYLNGMEQEIKECADGLCLLLQSEG